MPGNLGEKRMRALSLQAMARVGILAGLLAACSATVWAQAPAGPQPTSPGQDNSAPAQKPSTPQQQKPQEGGVSISVEVPVVTLDVVAATQNGDIIPGLKKENFRVLEDGQPQTITSFGPTDAPITMVVLMEFSARFYGWFGYQAKYWAGALFPNLNQKDWVALVTFDMRPRTEVDFTQNKQEVEAAIYHLYYPGFSESNLFDALLDTNERLKDVKGRGHVFETYAGSDDETASRNGYHDFCGGARQAVEQLPGNAQVPGHDDPDGFSAGGKPDEDVCADERRVRVVPAV
jgi:hypothetical protein